MQLVGWWGFSIRRKIWCLRCVIWWWYVNCFVLFFCGNKILGWSCCHDWHTTTYGGTPFPLHQQSWGIWSCNCCQYHVLKSKFRVRKQAKAMEPPPPPIQPTLSLGFLLFWFWWYVRFMGRGCQWRAQRRVSVALQKAQAATNLTSGSCGRRREREASSKLLVSFQVFLLSPCRTCFVLLVMAGLASCYYWWWVF